jgi:hypothetical protein
MSETDKDWPKYMPRNQQSDVQPDLRMPGCEHFRSRSADLDLLRSQQNERDRLKVAEKRQRETADQVKHYLLSIHLITIALHSGTTRPMIIV